MGKKKLRSTYTSRGERGPDVKITNAVRSDWNTSPDKDIAKQDAFLKGKKVYLTIDNPNPNETAKRKIRVPANEVWGDFRERAKGYTGLDAR